MNAATRLATTRGALLLMEALWVYALVAFTVAVTVGGDRPTPMGAAAVVGASFIISRALQSSEMPVGLMRFWGVVLSLLLFYVIIRIDFFGDWRLWDFTWADRLANDTQAALKDHAQAIVGVPLLWAFWLRGILRGQQHIDFEAVVGSFALGVIIVAFVEAFVGAVDAPSSIGYVAVPYVAVGLLAIGTTQAARADDDPNRPFAMTWFGVVAAALAIMAVLGALFMLADLGAASAALGFVGHIVGAVLGRVLYLVLWPFITLLTWVMEGLRWLFQQTYGTDHKNPLQQPVLPSPTATPDDQGTASLPAWFAWMLRIVIGVPLVAALLAGTALLFSRMRRREGADEERESSYEDGRLGEDLGGMLSGLFGGLRRGNRGDAGLDGARRLYFEVLEAGKQREVERKDTETPLELAPRLDRAFGSQTPSRVTSLFQDVRYGGIAPAPAKVQELREDWDDAKR